MLAPPDPQRPSRAREPIFNAPPTTLLLLAVVTSVFALLTLASQGVSHWVLVHLSLIAARVEFAIVNPFGWETLWTAGTFATHALVHLDFIHFAVNAGFLLAFGSLCERRLGPVSFALFFFACVIAGGITQLSTDWDRSAIMFGASGGVSGCMGGVVRIMMSDRLNPQRRRFARNLALVLVLLNIGIGVVGPELFGVDSGSIAWQAHLGGFAMGYLLMAVAGHPPRPSQPALPPATDGSQ